MCRPLTGALSLRTPRRVMDAGVLDLLLARGNEADFQCLRFDDHARDMACVLVSHEVAYYVAAPSRIARLARMWD